MLKKIIHPSLLLGSFLLLLALRLSKPQKSHLERVMEALIVSEGGKTLSALYRQWVDAPDVSAVADFFRDSPWSDAEIRKAQSEFTMSYLLRWGAALEKVGNEGKVIFVKIDDSTTRKDKDTTHIEGVDTVYDHSSSGKQKPGFCKGVVHVNCQVQIGSCTYDFGWRLYLRRSTLRRLNRQRKENGEKPLPFRTKYQLAREMLEELKPYFPADYCVYVLFDRWYASNKLIRYIRRQKWHVICALKSNRKIDGISIRERDRQMRHKRYTRVSISAADGNTVYYVRAVEGCLEGSKEKVRVIISRRHNRDNNPKCFLCTDLKLSVEKALTRYQHRWSLEVEYRYLKQELGLGDFRVRSVEAVIKWYTVVHLTFVFLQWCLYEGQRQGKPWRSIADVLRDHRAVHAQTILRAACEQALETGNVEAVLNRFIVMPKAA